MGPTHIIVFSPQCLLKELDSSNLTFYSLTKGSAIKDIPLL